MMSVAAGWKFISQGFGCAASAAPLVSNAATAPAPAKNFFFALIISPATRPQVQGPAERESPTVRFWFKPYSFSRRKKGAAESVRHFCAQSMARLAMRIGQPGPEAGGAPLLRPIRPFREKNSALRPYSGAIERLAVLFWNLYAA
jgi:hypothetical protein